VIFILTFSLIFSGFAINNIDLEITSSQDNISSTEYSSTGEYLVENLKTGNRYYYRFTFITENSSVILYPTYFNNTYSVLLDIFLVNSTKIKIVGYTVILFIIILVTYKL